MGGVRLYPSCPICLITASIIALRSARLAAQHGCLDCLGNEASKKVSCTFEAPAGGAKRRPLPPIPIQVARGRLSKQIAHDIGIAEATVKVHRSRAMQIYIICNGQPSVR
jgi:Bacterial regulatory proteins, luxR family